MSRNRKEPREAAARQLGLVIGESLSEGISQGIVRAFAAMEPELLPLGDAVVELLRREAVAVAKETEELIAADAARVCGQAGCPRRPVARGLCRRHYARQVYQERKTRIAGDGAAVPVRRVRSLTEGDEVSSEKKNVNAVAPIVRRRKDGEQAQAANGGRAETPAAAANGTNPGTVNVADVARFFGLK